MNKCDQDELDAFIAEAELVSQKIKALADNKISPEDFDKIEAARAQDKTKREQAVKRKEKQAHEKKKLGREGKGITKDFQNFCRFCHREYTLPTPVCLRCNKNTMTLEQRQEQLGVMVEEYKTKKKSRQERKHKWEMWQKTKSMLWKKTSNNYDKWDHFISDSEEEQESEPIVPKDDPNFKALEADMEQRKAARKKDTEQAKKLKQKGNALMKEGKYQQAMEKYTLALQFIRDMKSIYTNRALAFIKLGRFKKAIADCTNVIEYMEVFQKATDNKDLCFKAHIRRALANKELKNYQEALEDANAALKFSSNDKQALQLKKEVEGFIQHKQQVEKLLRQNKNPQSEKKEKQKEKQEEKEKEEEHGAEIEEPLPTDEQSTLEEKKIIRELAEASLIAENSKKEEKDESEEAQAEKKKVEKAKEQIKINTDNPIEEVKQRIENINQENIESLFILFKKKPELINIFIAAKGIKKCLERLMAAQECQKQGYLISCCLSGDGVGEKEVWDYNVGKIYDRVTQMLANQDEMSLSKYFILEDIFEVLIPMSLHEKYRELLSSAPETHLFIEKTFSTLITRHKKQPDLFSSFLIYAGNLCSGSSKLRDSFITGPAFQVIIGLLFEKVVKRKTSNRAYLNLKKNVYSLYANIIINQEHRVKFNAFLSEEEEDGEVKKQRWDELVREVAKYPRVQDNFTEYMQALLSIFTNATLGTALNVPGLSEALIDRFLSNPKIYDTETVYRTILVLTRIKHSNLQNFKQMLKHFNTHLQVWKQVKENRNLMDQIVIALNMMYMGIDGVGNFNEPFPNHLLKECKTYISSLEFGEKLFCNTCNLMGLILDKVPDYRPTMYAELKPLIKFLIGVAKDKIGNYRKNASILLAKLSLNPDCKDELYKNHGMDVLKSIADFVKK